MPWTFFSNLLVIVNSDYYLYVNYRKFSQNTLEIFLKLVGNLQWTFKHPKSPFWYTLKLKSHYEKLASISLELGKLI